MPTPGEEDSVQEADLDDEGAFPAGPEEMRPGTPTERSWGGWSEQEWKRWNAYYAWSTPSGDPGLDPGMVQGQHLHWDLQPRRRLRHLKGLVVILGGETREIHGKDMKTVEVELVDKIRSRFPSTMVKMIGMD